MIYKAPVNKWWKEKQVGINTCLLVHLVLPAWRVYIHVFTSPLIDSLQNELKYEVWTMTDHIVVVY
jgi:hypothetical protein